ncbi:MAG: fibronectin type III domain-containing protein, partial [Bacteroidales bacterium]|nr:fibronectin type III domain-containing protein [Bacteroidales bacterium]
PSTPSGLSTSAITSSSATLSWSAATGATSYDVQVRPQGGSWSTFSSSTTSYSLSGLSSATTYEWQVRATNSAGSSSYSSYISFTTTTVVATYCTSKGNTFSDEWISSVAVGSFSNSSAAAGYTDFTSKTITMTVGTAYSVTLTPGFGGSSYAEGWRVWIDLNGDADFDDAGELVFAPTATSKTAVSGTITIPAGTATGTTRMRVSMKYNAFPTACETFSYGEVEDYTVNIVSGQANPPATPTGLSTSGISTSGASLSWSASTGATSYSVQVRPQGGSWSTYSTSSTSYSLSGLAAATTYEWQVRANNANGSSSYATAISFTTQSVSLTYCTSKGSNSSYEWIDLVQFAGIDRTSGNDGGYKDMTSMVASVAPGGSYTIYFSAGFGSSSYTEYWAVWIDFNQNGTFDADEKVATGSSSSSATLSATVAIPTTALLGNTRMRVSMKYNAAQTACEAFSYGEVEDYTVNISDNRNNYNDNPFAEELGNDEADVYSIYPNPASDRLKITLNGIEGEVSLRIYDLQGRLVKQTMLNNFDTEINVDDLAKGVYIISVDEEKLPINKRFVKM